MSAKKKHSHESVTNFIMSDGVGNMAFDLKNIVHISKGKPRQLK